MTQSHPPENNTQATHAKLPKTYPCPRCGVQAAWQDNPSKPFCSPRCKLIDLGAWANEDYKVAAEDSPFYAEVNQDYPE